ncbi:MAG: hypothetical protein ACERKD_04460 [Prolixibacteraceae bacterium]
MKTKYTNSSPLNISSLLDKMHTEDNRNIRIMRNAKWLMFILSPVYLLIFNIGPADEMNIYLRLSGVSFALAFLIFAIIFTKYLKIYRSVDYGQPTVLMLTNAVKRYKMQLSKIALSIIPIIFVNLGVTLISIGEEGERLFEGHYLKFQLIYWPMIAGALFIGLLIWRKKQKPLKDAAEKLLKDIQSE